MKDGLNLSIRHKSVKRQSSRLFFSSAQPVRLMTELSSS